MVPGVGGVVLGGMILVRPLRRQSMSTAELLTPLPKLVSDDFEHYEIIDGIEVEMPPMSADSTIFASRLSHKLHYFGVERNLGEAHTEALFKLPLPQDRNRRPDVAFVPYSRWPKE